MPTAAETLSCIASRAGRALASSVTWSRTGTAWGFDSDKGMERFAADAKNLSRGATEWSRVGDTRAEMPKAASTLEAEYRCDYAYHAQMEPLNAIASRRGYSSRRASIGLCSGLRIAWSKLPGRTAEEGRARCARLQHALAHGADLAEEMDVGFPLHVRAAG